MEEDNINLIIQDAINSKEESLENENKIITNLKDAILENYHLFEAVNKIDIENNNALYLDKNIIEKIFNNYSNIKPLINSKIDSRITHNDLLTTNIYTNLGIVHVIFDGNTYTMLQLIILGILTHNILIFSYDGYMLGTNGLLIELLDTLLIKNGYSKGRFQHVHNLRAEVFFDHFKTINKTLIIGDQSFQNKYMQLCKNEVMLSGFNNYEIYIEDLTHIDLINKIISADLNIDVYINSSLEVDIEDAFFVEDAYEAISKINFTGAGYSSAIFTSNEKNASKFIKQIKSKNVFVNVSPTIQQRLDIEEKDLLKEKNIILSNIYKFEGTRISIHDKAS